VLLCVCYLGEKKKEIARGERVISLIEEVEDLAAVHFKRRDTKDLQHKEDTIR